MTTLSSIPPGGALLDVFKTFPATARHLISYHEALMRGPSPLSEGERELIAAYVSGLNACTYCHGIHAVTAQAFGADPALIEALVADFDAAPVDDRLRPLLHLARALTRLPAKIVSADFHAIREAGWGDAAIHDTVAVTALFNFMNRYVEGFGLTADSAYTELAGRRLHDGGYAGLLKLLPP